MSQGKLIGIILTISAIILTVIYVFFFRKSATEYVPTDTEIFKTGLAHENETLQIYDNQVTLTFKKRTSFKNVKRTLYKLKATIDGNSEKTSNIYTINLELNFKDIKSGEDYCDVVVDTYKEIESCTINKINNSCSNTEKNC